MALTLPAASACHMDDKVTAAVPFDSTDEGVELRLRLRIAAGQVAALAIENRRPAGLLAVLRGRRADEARSEEHTSELQSLMRISYAVFCLQKQKYNITYATQEQRTTTNT